MSDYQAHNSASDKSDPRNAEDCFCGQDICVCGHDEDCKCAGCRRRQMEENTDLNMWLND